MPKHISQTSTEWTNLSGTVDTLVISGAPAGVAWLTSSNFTPDGGTFAVTGTVSGTSGTFGKLTASALTATNLVAATSIFSEMTGTSGRFETLFASGTGGAYYNVSTILDSTYATWYDYEGAGYVQADVSNSALAPISNNMAYMRRGKMLRVYGATYWSGVGAATGGTHMFSIPIAGVAGPGPGSNYASFPVAYFSGGGTAYTAYVQLSGSSTGTTFILADVLPSASNVVMNWTTILF